MAISKVPWFATTVERPFGVGTGGIFATIVRVVQAFVCVWVIILVNIKFILPEQTGSQYSHQYNITIYCAVKTHFFSRSDFRTWHQSPLKLRRNRSQIILPVQLYPSPSYPGLQEQVNDPWVLWHKAFSWQLLKSVLHSSTLVVYTRTLLQRCQSRSLGDYIKKWGGR